MQECLQVYWFQKCKQQQIEKGVECRIQATGEAEVKEYIDDIDVLLLGPQVRFLLSKFKKSLADKNIPVEVINTRSLWNNEW